MTRADGRQRELDARLEDWAEYMVSVNGYPSSTTLSRGGGSGGKPGSKPPKGIGMPREICETNAAVKQLGDAYPRRRLAIAIRYGFASAQWTAQWRARTSQGEQSFYKALGEGRAWLDAKLLG